MKKSVKVKGEVKVKGQKVTETKLKSKDNPLFSFVLSWGTELEILRISSDFLKHIVSLYIYIEKNMRLREQYAHPLLLLLFRNPGKGASDKFLKAFISVCG